MMRPLMIQRALLGPGSALLLLSACAHGKLHPSNARMSGADLSQPPALTAQALSPFAIRITWPAAPNEVAGYDVELENHGQYVRVAHLSRSRHEFVHHLRLPGQSYRYRVRDLDARGALTCWLPVVVATPERAATSNTSAAFPPCIALPPARDPARVRGAPREVLNEQGDHPLYSDPEGDDGSTRHLIGQYAGCARDFGAFQLQADILLVPGFVDEGWPLLHAISGASQIDGAQILTLRFARGRYTVVDEARLCGEEPADGCQEDAF
jgi:hypothetical protein